MTSPIGLYIHVPFCARKCPYCDFYSEKFSHETAEKFVSALVRNLEFYKGRGIEIDSVYCGGGTPSLLSASQWERILSSVQAAFSLQKDTEITLEANPSLIAVERYKGFVLAGFNRISLGVQSFCDDELKALGRLHDGANSACAIENAYSAGFLNISTDLMLGIIGQDFSSLDRNLERIGELPLSHISAYMLKVEAGTPYDCRKILEKLPIEDEVCDLYLRAAEGLERLGFLQYEISNFAKSGKVSRHNLHYWRCEEYIGIGPSAHSYYGGKRFFAQSSLEKFIEEPLQGMTVTDENAGSDEERAMLGLRLCGGFGLDISSGGIRAAKLEGLEKLGLLTTGGGKISLTPKGCLISNAVIGELLV